MSEKTLVIRAEEGRVVESKVVNGKVTEIVKDIAYKVLKEWNPETSDYVIIKDKYEVSLKLPISKEDFKRFSKYNIRRTSDGYAVFNVPVYVVSYENEWRGDDYVDKKVYVICTYVNDEVRKDIESWASESTSSKRGLEIELSEDEIKELEELEE